MLLQFVIYCWRTLQEQTALAATQQLILLLLQHFNRLCSRIVSVPYLDQTLNSNSSKVLRQKFKLKIFPDRVNLALSENDLNFNFCRVVFENLDFVQIRYKLSESAVLLSLFLPKYNFVHRFLLNLWNFLCKKCRIPYSLFPLVSFLRFVLNSNVLFY